MSQTTRNILLGFFSTLICISAIFSYQNGLFDSIFKKEKEIDIAVGVAPTTSGSIDASEVFTKKILNEDEILPQKIDAFTRTSFHKSDEVCISLSNIFPPLSTIRGVDIKNNVEDFCFYELRAVYRIDPKLPKGILVIVHKFTKNINDIHIPKSLLISYEGYSVYSENNDILWIPSKSNDVLIKINNLGPEKFIEGNNVIVDDFIKRFPPILSEDNE